ncbi:MAG: peptidylprolyl isomerase [Candidatus Omnitrophica bacterium]|nr:peptidylprolyl isomerase [Candidatus Omnitrophota bacterium]
MKSVIALLLAALCVAGFQQKGLAMESKIVVLETNQGNIEIQLMPDVAPKACENFQKLVEKGYYNGIIFHRVIKQFMIQGGDPTGTGTGGESIWGAPFADEVRKDVRFDKAGILAMANAGPNTNGSQFFITVAPTPWLNMRHTIFGKVIAGYDVVQKIENTATNPSDRPLSEQKIIKAFLKAAQ